ncbi:MAG: sulfatase-like hydrolase/transferase [Chitinophagales bacterium]|nr:sulfatase-like hydrolase/transferase [Chitinophagales bacterium]MDW8427096.1 sulfatase-like hydrolase/transferase [Chitinophagales bacterium]
MCERLWVCALALWMCSTFTAGLAQSRLPAKIIEVADTLTLQEAHERYGIFAPRPPTASASATRDDRPNIIFIMVDDSRWDSYGVNGGPSWFKTPAIDRLALEGANFKNFFAVLPLCTPSRGTFFTGMYPHRHGATTNPEEIDCCFPWISEILQANGYYTVLSGKLGFDLDSLRGFDDYLVAITESYSPAKYLISTGNSVIKVVIGGHTTDIIKNYAVGRIISRPPGQPFFLFMAHRAPHVPYIPRPQEKDIFDTIPMPYPENANKYTKNFPSYYYPDNEAGDSIVQDSTYRGYFELLAGVEAVTGAFLKFLEDTAGILDQCLIMYTSDNGNLKSEHKLQGKQLPLEESIRLPMFIRYPKWFPEPVEVYDVMGINVDWAPTILDAAGIPNTYGMQGHSLRALYQGEVKRNAFLYEVWSEIEKDPIHPWLANETPAIRAVRTPYFKYIKSFCNSTTEQLFDLINDPKENVNLINDPYYQKVADYYRCLLDSIRQVYGDFYVDTILNCKLKNVDYSHVGASTDPGPIGPCIYIPADVDTSLNVGLGSIEARADCEVVVFTLGGQPVYRGWVAAATVSNVLQEQGRLPAGVYVARFCCGDHLQVRRIVLQ